MNPVPIEFKPRVLTTLIDMQDGAASLDLALSVVPYFNLSLQDGRKIAAEVAASVSKWRKAAAATGLPRSEIERMASAFEHHDLEAARASSAVRPASA